MGYLVCKSAAQQALLEVRCHVQEREEGGVVVNYHGLPERRVLHPVHVARGCTRHLTRLELNRVYSLDTTQKL